MNRKGWTVIETFVVMIIFGILIALAIPKYKVATIKAKMQEKEKASVTKIDYKSKLIVNIDNEVNNAFRIGAEFGYFEGQKDALNKDIRIAQDCCEKPIYSFDPCSTYKWIKSPWDNNPNYIYDPKLSIQENYDKQKEKK